MGILEILLIGLAAGLIGTVALTITEMIVMKAAHLPSSTVPGQVGAKLTGIKPQDDAEMEKLSTKVHWVHGISLGIVYGLLSLLGLPVLITVLLFFALVWGGDVLLYKTLGIAQFPWHWKANELLPDLFNKGIYALATGIAFLVISNLFK